MLPHTDKPNNLAGMAMPAGARLILTACCRAGARQPGLSHGSWSRAWLLAGLAVASVAGLPEGFVDDVRVSGRTGLDCPTQIVFLPDGRAIIAQRTGGLYIGDPDIPGFPTQEYMRECWLSHWLLPGSGLPLRLLALAQPTTIACCWALLPLLARYRPTHR